MMNFTAAYPEIFLLISACLILLIDMFVKDAQRWLTHCLSIVAVGICMVISLAWLGMDTSVHAFNNLFVLDPMAVLLKAFSCLAVLITFIYSRSYIVDRGIVGGLLGGEFYVLALFSLLGQMVMISGNNFLSIYLGLELMSLSLYALIAMRREHSVSIEAAMKYFVLGALASGFLLYGISMLYGATGTLDLNEVSRQISKGSINNTVLLFGLVFLVAGLAFKLGVVPFHMWVPDVYQGAPTAVVLLLGAAPKLAAFGICMRLLVQGLFPLSIDWQHMLLVLAVLSISVGNVAAIAQTNLKRMLAYSTISQMGFVILGLLSGNVPGATNVFTASIAYGSAMFYAVTYVLTTLGAFGLILVMSKAGFEAEEIADFKGLNRRSPWFAFIMLLLIFSLAGVPPMVGFYAKLSVLESVISTGQIWLAIFAVVFSLIGAFYYLRVIKFMYFDEPIDITPLKPSNNVRVVLSLNGLSMLILGILPGSLMAICSYVILKSLVS